MQDDPKLCPPPDPACTTAPYYGSGFIDIALRSLAESLQRTLYTLLAEGHTFSSDAVQSCNRQLDFYTDIALKRNLERQHAKSQIGDGESYPTDDVV